MRMIFKQLLLAMGFGLCAFSAPMHAADGTPGNQPGSSVYDRKVDDLVSRYEAFQIAVQNDENFRKSWVTRLKLSAALKPKTAATPHFALSIGTEILLDGINPYLRRSDDDSVIAYMTIMTKIFSFGAKDELICRIFMGAADKKAVTDSENERVEKMLGPEFYEEMIVAIGRVMRAGKSAPEYSLAESESERIIIEMLGFMMDDYGQESVAKMQKLDDKNTANMVKCTTMMQMLNSMAKLEKKTRLL